MRKILLLVLLAVTALQGCVSLPAPEQMAEELKGFELPAKPDTNSTLVYVVRPSALGALIRFNVFLDSKADSAEMGYTRGTQHIYFSMPAGKHQIFSKAENWADVIIETKGGDTVFIRQDTHMGFIMARNSLVVIDPLEGAYYVKNTQPGNILKTQN